MPNIEIYTWEGCPFCIRAKALLDSKGVNYTEHKIDGDEAARAEMAERTGNPEEHYTVPQIFIDNQYIGDCSKIHRLDEQGGLDPLVGIRNDGPQNGLGSA